MKFLTALIRILNAFAAIRSGRVGRRIGRRTFGKLGRRIIR